jgi:hypothetical protein
MTRAEKERLEKRHEREVFVSRAKLVLIVVCLIAIPVTFWVNHSDVGSVDKRVTKVESPCLRYGSKSPQCKAAFEAAVATITHPQACAIERKAGTLRAIRELAQKLGVDFKEPCAGARLAQERQRGTERDAASRLSNGNNGGGALEPSGWSAPESEGDSTAPGQNQGGDSPAPDHAGNPHVSQPPNSGSEGGAGPVSQGPVEASGGSTPTEGNPSPEDNGGSTGETQHESVLESAGATVGEVVKGAGEVLDSAKCGLTGPLLCPKH